MKKKEESKKYAVKVYEPGRELTEFKKFKEYQDAVDTAKDIFRENPGYEVEIETWTDGHCQMTEIVRKGRWFLHVFPKE